MKINIPQYNGVDHQVMFITVPTFSFVVNCVNFGAGYFSDFWFFITSSLIALVWLSIDFVVCGAIAVFFKKRFPAQKDVIKRLSFMIVTFLIVTGLFLSGLFGIYETVDYFNYRFNPKAFAWSYLLLAVFSVFLTFLMEGISRYQEWRLNREETEKLAQEFKKSQLQGLKSQVSPHFLYNCLNSLSSLIQHDEEEAEEFLDEMSKVYRYMLSNDEEQLVTLETELKFTGSYMHLLKARFGDALQLKVRVQEEQKSKLMAPLSLQLLIENAFSQNIVSKSKPLQISIESTEDGFLDLRNNIQPKIVTELIDFEAGLDNLIRKYELLGQPVSVMENQSTCRLVRIPLITQTDILVS